MTHITYQWGIKLLDSMSRHGQMCEVHESIAGAGDVEDKVYRMPRRLAESFIRARRESVQRTMKDTNTGIKILTN